MLAYISVGMGLCNIVVLLVFGLTWIELHGDIKANAILQEDFQAAVRRLVISVGLFVIPVLAYLFEGTKQSAKVVEPYALAWGAAYALSLLILIARIVTLTRDAKREKKMRRYRR